MIIANWKMNGSKELIKEWIELVSKDIEIKEGKECVFCPPSCYLDFAGSIIRKSKKQIKLGSQQLDSKLSDSLTGGINARMLADFDCEYVIIGHSEQRLYLNESNEMLSDKLKVAINKNLKPIFCIGESLEQKKDNQTKQILLEQLEVIPINLLDSCIIAYEPIWAIGTGENAELNYIEEIHTFIKKELKIKRKSKNFVSVVYGGSVNLENYEQIYSSSKVDGLLIGGASLDSSAFTEIYNMS